MNRAPALKNKDDLVKSIDLLYRKISDLTNTVNINTVDTNNSNNSLSGTLTLDDGSNWRLVLKFYKGNLVKVETSGSTSAEINWK